MNPEPVDDEVMMIRYRLKPGQAETERLRLRAIFEELDEKQPEDIQYASFLLEDGLTCIDLVIGGGSGRLADLESFQAYRRNLEDRCDEPPQLTSLENTGKYRFIQT